MHLSQGGMLDLVMFDSEDLTMSVLNGSLVPPENTYSTCAFSLTELQKNQMLVVLYSIKNYTSTHHSTAKYSGSLENLPELVHTKGNLVAESPLLQHYILTII